jgi:hypothetical protein
LPLAGKQQAIVRGVGEWDQWVQKRLHPERGSFVLVDGFADGRRNQPVFCFEVRVISGMTDVVKDHAAMTR